MRKRQTLFCAMALTLALSCGAAETQTIPEARLSLANSLRASGEYSLSALEFRRMAADLEPGDPALPALFLSAADAYRLERRWDRMGRMIDAAEDANASGTPLLYLRLRRAEGLRDWPSAADYAEDLAAVAPGGSPLSDWARRSAEVSRLRAAGLKPGEGKSPRVGGLLGIIPGMGYAYSGEWGNAFRSIFLNGLFGWAMFECADHERWGLFGITTFFELTWYTGSIYGGIDATHRYNRRLLDEEAAAIMGDAHAPRLERDPRIEFFSLKLAF